MAPAIPVPDHLPVPERVLLDLLHRHWRMTIEGQGAQEVFVAYRPIGWSGEGDPFERISAPTRLELLRLLAHRHLATTKPSTTKNTPATPAATKNAPTCTTTPAAPATVRSVRKEGSPPMPRKPDPNRPLTPEEEEAVRRQGEHLRWQNDTAPAATESNQDEGEGQ